MPDVTVADAAFIERRYDRLARLCGLADADHARGKMLVLWRQCFVEGSDELTADDVRDVLGENGPMALVDARLAEWVEDSDGQFLRIRGADDRLKRRERSRSNGAQGGRPAAEEVTARFAEEHKRALDGADYLRRKLLEEQPDHRLSKRAWDDTDPQRLKWANVIRLMVERDGRSYDDIASTVKWLFDGQTNEAKFIVQSPESLREKWDRIQAVRTNQERPRAPSGPQVEMRPLP